MYTDTDDSPKMATSNPSYLDQLRGTQSETFDLLSDLEARLSSVSHREPQDSTSMQESTDHLAQRVDDAKYINSIVRRITNQLAL